MRFCSQSMIKINGGKSKYWETHTELLIKNLDEWRKAVSCARSIADDGLIGAVGISIDTDHIGWYVTLTRCGDQNLLGTRLNVLACSFSVHKYSCSFDHQVNSQIPGQITERKGRLWSVLDPFENNYLYIIHFEICLLSCFGNITATIS